VGGGESEIAGLLHIHSVVCLVLSLSLFLSPFLYSFWRRFQKKQSLPFTFSRTQFNIQKLELAELFFKRNIVKSPLIVSLKFVKSLYVEGKPYLKTVELKNK
jgi:hypothetical protein